MSEAGDDPGGPHRSDEVGSVGEEAAKLLGAVADWARDHGNETVQGLGGLAGSAAAMAADINDHVATGSPECTYCPVCRTVHAVRQTTPEVRAQLATAASSFLQAAAGFLATLPSAGGDASRSSEFEKIDLDDLDETDGSGGPDR